MKEIIKKQIRCLAEAKAAGKIEPSLPNEHELKLSLQNMVNAELDSLVESGEVVAIGVTINKHRILGLLE